MLWEIGQDAIGEDGDYSLLHYVHNTAMTGGVGTFFPKIKNLQSYNLTKVNWPFT